MQPYAYLRKSSVRDPARDTSPETQEREVRALAARHDDNGAQLVLLADWDISGRGQFTAKRSSYLQLIEAIKSGECRAVYSYSLSRLGRSVAELARLFDLCRDRKVPIRLVADSIDTSTASGVLLANVLSSVAQFEADVTSERMRAMFATKRARGEPIGNTPKYGDGEGDDLAAVMAAFAEAGSYSGAARLLNERGIKPRNSKRGWWPSSVAVVVQRVQPMRRPKGQGRKAGGVDFILGGLLRCPTCGTRLTGLRDRLDGPNRGRVRYACRLGSVTPHPRVSVSEHLILPAIQAEAERFDPRTEADQIALEAEDERRRQLDAKRVRVLDMYAEGLIDKAERARRLEEVDAGVARLDVKRSLLDIPQHITWSAPPKDVNAILRALWGDVRLDPTTFQPVGFEWRVPPEYVA